MASINPTLNGNMPEANGHIIKPDQPDLPTSTSTFDTLKSRIKTHYNLLTPYYHRLWGEHIHHGYFLAPSDTKEIAQIQLIQLLLQKSKLQAGRKVIDVGCGIGGTSRYLARELGCIVTGVTISGEQVSTARRLSGADDRGDGFVSIGDKAGSVRFLEMDAEKLGEQTLGTFDAVWISEALSHFPDKPLFFRNAFSLLQSGGKVVVADWFRAEDLTSAQEDADIKPIEAGMLLPPLCTQNQYVQFATDAGLRLYSEPMDISEQVAKTWDISVSLVASPALWALAFTQGRDVVGFLQAFNAMRRGFQNGGFRYAVVVFER